MNLPVKYRPKNFKEIVGQEHVTITLYNALKTRNIAHAYLFAGPRGVGKTTTARILAKGLNCEKGITPEPCNKCASCIEIDRSVSMDVVEIDGASNRGIDQIRDLRENIRLMPVRGRFKVYIIDEVHMLTQEAFNALLKTLEEPPEHVVFIFATTEPRKVPETVLSRVQRFDFRPLSPEDIVPRLKEIAEKENIKIENSALHKLAKYASGSLRDAISLLEQLWVYSGGEIKEKHVTELLGIIGEDFYIRFFELISKNDVKGALKFVAGLLSQGISPQEFTRGLQESTEKLLKAKYGLENNVFQNIAGNFSETEILALMNSALKLEEAIKYSVNPEIWLNFYVAKMALLSRILKVEEVLEKAGVTFLEKQEKEEKKKPEPAITFEEDTKDYEGFLNYLKKESPFLYEKLKDTRAQLKNNTLEIQFKEKTDYRDMLNHLKELEEDAEIFFAKKIEIKLIEPIAKTDPRIQKLLKLFDLKEVKRDV